MEGIKFQGVLRANSKIFAIYEYSKIIYPMSNNNQLIVKNLKDNEQHMIAVPQLTEAIYDIEVSDNNKIITIQKIKNEFYIVKYQQADRRQFKVHNNLKNFVTIHQFKNTLVCQFESDEKDTQIIVFDIKTMKIKTTGFINQHIQDIKITENTQQKQRLSLMASTSTIKLFLIQQHLSLTDTIILNNSKQQPYFLLHDWIDPEYCVVLEVHQVYLFRQNKLIQKIALKHKAQYLAANHLGFYVCGDKKITCFRKKRQKFEEFGTLKLQDFDICNKIIISPSQNLLLIGSNNGAVISLDIDNQTGALNQQQCQLRLQINPFKQLIGFTTSQILPYYATIQKQPYILKIYHSETHTKILTYELTLGEGDSIYDIIFHPYLPEIAISCQNQIKIYRIMYSQLKQVIILPVKKCRKLQFNNSGSIICCSYGIGKGTKLQLYNSMNGLLIQTIWIGVQVITMLWNKLDHHIYVVHEQGYYRWQAQTLFKQRFEYQNNNKISGGFIENDKVILYNENTIKIVQKQKLLETINLSLPIRQIIKRDELYYFCGMNGTLYSNHNLQLGLLCKSRLSLFKNQFRLKLCKYRVACINNKGEIIIFKQKKDIIQKDKGYILVDREQIHNIIHKLRNYEEELKQIWSKTESAMDQLKRQLGIQQQNFLNKYRKQFQQIVNKYNHSKEINQKLEDELKLNNQLFQNHQLKAIGQLEKLYDRKIALTTNKYLTSEEMNFRNMIVASENLKKLEYQYEQNIKQIRQQYYSRVKKVAQTQGLQKNQVLKTRKQYEQRMGQLQQQYQKIFLDIQLEYDALLKNQKRVSSEIQNKYRTTLSEKQELESQLERLTEQNNILSYKLKSQDSSNELYQRKMVHMKTDSQNLNQIIKKLEDRIAQYQYKIKDLQKTKEILTFRVLQTRSMLEPKEQAIQQFQQQFIKLEEELDASVKENFTSEQKIQSLKKQILFIKGQLNSSRIKQKKSRDEYEELINRIYDIVTKKQTQQWVGCLLKLYEQYCRIIQSRQKSRLKSKNPIDQLNRVRIHLQNCLDQVVTSNQKVQTRKSQEFVKKIKQNAQLIFDVNQLRRKLKQNKDILQEKNQEIQKLKAMIKQPEYNIQRRFKTEGGDDVRRTKNSFGKRTFYKRSQDETSFTYTKTGHSHVSKRIIQSATKGMPKRNSNYESNNAFLGDMQRSYQQQIEQYRRKIIQLQRTVQDLRYKSMIKNQ